MCCPGKPTVSLAGGGSPGIIVLFIPVAGYTAEPTWVGAAEPTSDSFDGEALDDAKTQQVPAIAARSNHSQHSKIVMTEIPTHIPKFPPIVPRKPSRVTAGEIEISST
mmetsp:Transcript_26061/g.40776  ORF Transcript_26061/g.40776 Transcript_26061/m.40776 type:complete len:108 (-) Transcript_26061:901-1224(-)